jgi:hypothetical protein
MREGCADQEAGNSKWANPFPITFPVGMGATGLADVVDVRVLMASSSLLLLTTGPIIRPVNRYGRTAATMADVSERIMMLQTGHKNMAVLRRYIREGSVFRENATAAVGL